jgi:hypothetical protein
MEAVCFDSNGLEKDAFRWRHSRYQLDEKETGGDFDNYLCV